jgi:NADH-quinone oxidoreductase subunit L
VNLIWLIPVLPLAGFTVLLLAGRRIGNPAAGWLATGLVAGSFLVSVKLYLDLLGMPAEERVLAQTLFEWIPAGGLRVDIGFLFDPLSAVMCLFITGIGALIHLYSIGYMADDPEYHRFFTYLNLFVASMLLLVLGDNLLLTFLGWEGVGACSYLLISFWFTDPANAGAGKKAFVTNRIGDFGFMLATFLVFVTIGSINYSDIVGAAPGIGGGTATAITLLFFLAATGKSAQLPLFVWLPDAMAGPTPVSALIHAATMVTSGVFLLTRLNPVLGEAAGWSTGLIAWVGLLTAMLAAGAAVAQNDIKKVLAYSTVSQLGFMFLAIGTGSFVAAIFHMVTHAFFKALLFLGAGAVIHSMAHEQDMRRYGQLRKYLPITAATMTIGWLAIAGIPPFSGFWSKDEILAGTWTAPLGPLLFVLTLLTAILTAFYMTRMMVLTFAGGTEKWRELDPGHTHGAVVGLEPGEEELASEEAPVTLAAGAAHSGHDDHHHLTPDYTPHESPPTMLVPLVVLAVFAALAGFMNLPFAHSVEFLGTWLEPTIVVRHSLPSGGMKIVLALIAIAGAALGVFLGYRVYQQHKGRPERIEQPVLAHAWHIDETYARIIGGPGEAAFQGVADFDATVVDGAVNGVATGSRGLGTRLRGLQSGLVRGYALGVGVGAVLLLLWAVTRMAV